MVFYRFKRKPFLLQEIVDCFQGIEEIVFFHIIKKSGRRYRGFVFQKSIQIRESGFHLFSHYEIKWFPAGFEIYPAFKLILEFWVSGEQVIKWGSRVGDQKRGMGQNMKGFEFHFQVHQEQEFLNEIFPGGKIIAADPVMVILNILFFKSQDE
jgi:hypothetical protein